MREVSRASPRQNSEATYPVSCKRRLEGITIGTNSSAQDFGMSACAQKSAVLAMANIKMNQRVPNKNADLLEKITLIETEPKTTNIHAMPITLILVEIALNSSGK